MEMDRKEAHQEVHRLLATGVYDQNEIFGRIYPQYRGHYAVLRNMISDIKNDMKKGF